MSYLFAEITVSSIPYPLGEGQVVFEPPIPFSFYAEPKKEKTTYFGVSSDPKLDLGFISHAPGDMARDMILSVCNGVEDALTVPMGTLSERKREFVVNLLSRVKSMPTPPSNPDGNGEGQASPAV